MAKHNGPYCGGKLHGRDGTCTRPAGWGTSHVGHGRCRKHFGNAPNVIKAAERERTEPAARRVLAGIGDHEPVTDPVDELQRLAGRAGYLPRRRRTQGLPRSPVARRTDS